MISRTVEDHLREEYFNLSPDIHRALKQLQTEVAHSLLQITLSLKNHERILIEGRAKECQSAINTLRRKREERQFDESAPNKYTLTQLPDLAGVRVLVFPKPLLERVHSALRSQYADWVSDPVNAGTSSAIRAWKYYGHCSTSPSVQAELQVVSMLTGLFWQVEHDAFYKPLDATLRGAAKKPTVQAQVERVYDAFDALEDTLEHELKIATRSID